jgi:hypothetical protein
MVTPFEYRVGTTLTEGFLGVDDRCRQASAGRAKVTSVLHQTVKRKRGILPTSNRIQRTKAFSVVGGWVDKYPLVFHDISTAGRDLRARRVIKRVIYFFPCSSAWALTASSACHLA